MKKKERLEVDGRELVVSNVDKIYFPETGFTKGEVIAFYSEIADVIMPHLRDRPLTMKRFPEGVTGEHFYEKNAPKHTPPWVETFAVPRSEGGPAINYILCNDRATLLWTANLGDIEKHVLLARAPDLLAPTSIVFDLDPGPPAGHPRMRRGGAASERTLRRVGAGVVRESLGLERAAPERAAELAVRPTK